MQQKNLEEKVKTSFLSKSKNFIGKRIFFYSLLGSLAFSFGCDGSVLTTKEHNSVRIDALGEIYQDKDNYQDSGEETFQEINQNQDVYQDSESYQNISQDALASTFKETAEQETTEQEAAGQELAGNNLCQPQKCYKDNDEDGYGTNADMKIMCECMRGYIGKDGDCDDGNPAINPDMKEICGGKDNDCDGNIDENLSKKCYTACGEGVEGCVNGKYLDCDAPQPKEEVCDGLDNDCNGKVDDGLTISCYTACGKGIEVCINGVWKDCDAPLPQEEICDGKDNNCDTEIDEGCVNCKIYQNSYHPVDGKCCTEGSQGGLLCIIDFLNSPGDAPIGLTWDGKYLWHSDTWNEKIYKLSTEGDVVDSFASPGPNPQGLAWDGQYIWCSDAGYDRVYKLTAAGKVVDSFNLPGFGLTGLAWDGQYLWQGDVYNDKIYMLTVDGQIIKSFNSPGQLGLTWDGEYLWNSAYGKIHKFTTTGKVINSFDVPTTGPSGGFSSLDLAWDGQYLWNADFLSKKIYKLEIIKK